MKKIKWNERGAVTIIEAVFVFPITFFIVFFMIMAGEAYYQHACVEYAVTTAAINGAASCENPMLEYVLQNGVPTDPAATEVMPYRYIFTNEAGKIGGTISRNLDDSVQELRPLLFTRMKPENVHVKIEPHLNPLVSSFPVECTFEVPFPIRMIFTDQQMRFFYKVNMTASVGDPSEFLRITALVRDMVARSKKISDFCSTVKEGMDKVGAYIN